MQRREGRAAEAEVAYACMQRGVKEEDESQRHRYKNKEERGKRKPLQEEERKYYTAKSGEREDGK